MPERVKVSCRWTIGVAVLLGAACGLACSQNAFQPIAYGAKPWQPPLGWKPEQMQAGQPCVVGYYIAIDSCEGCTGISYALCTGQRFDQCACGTSYVPGTLPGSMCPQTLVCSADDLPPQGWQEFTDYTGPGYYGYGKSSSPTPPADGGAGD
jgi:hypothetical protein